MTTHHSSLQLLLPITINISLDEIDPSTRSCSGALTKDDIPIAWTQDDQDLRLDVTLPSEATFEMTLPGFTNSLILNGITIWQQQHGQIAMFDCSKVIRSEFGLNLNCNFGGALHIMAIFDQKRKNAK